MYNIDRPRPLTFFCAALCGALVLTNLSPSSSGLGLKGAHAQSLKGITVSCPRDGRIWGEPIFEESLVEMKALGANAVAIHPYAWVGKDGSVRAKSADALGYLERAVQMAKRQKVSLFMKPHLGYWGRFSWRGAIEFDSPEKWARFFKEYEVWILDHARFAQKHNIPILAVGTELEKMGERKEWEGIIKKVRALYKGKITWAANWDGVARIPFWEDLDYIGIQAYFPLGDGSDAAARLEWKKAIDYLAAFSAAHQNKKILFTEIGYARSTKAASEPWKPQNDSSKEVIALRTRMMNIAFEEMAKSPLIEGAYWWKWIPGSNLFDSDFSMKDPEAKTSMKRFWKKQK